MKAIISRSACFIATLFTVLFELVRLFLDRAVDEHLTLWVF
jgi:hypothetical protein